MINNFTFYRFCHSRPLGVSFSGNPVFNSGFRIKCGMTLKKHLQIERNRFGLHDKAMRAMRLAIRGVIKKHLMFNMPLAIWDDKNQKVKYVSPQTALKIFNKEND